MFAVAPAELPWGARLRRAAGPTCEHLWCSASARCVPPGSCFQGAHGLGRWLPTLLGGVPKRSSWPRRACMGRPRATFSGRHKSSSMQFLLLERIGRKRRRALTTFLNTSWSRKSASPFFSSGVADHALRLGPYMRISYYRENFNMDTGGRMRIGKS